MTDPKDARIAELEAKLKGVETQLDDTLKGVAAVYIKLKEHAPYCGVSSDLMREMAELQIAPVVKNIHVPSDFFVVVAEFAGMAGGLAVRGVRVPGADVLVQPIGPFATVELAEQALRKALDAAGYDSSKLTEPEAIGAAAIKAAGYTPESLLAEVTATIHGPAAKRTVH